MAKILVIEDDHSIRFAITDFLASQMHTVEALNAGKMG